MKGLLRSRRFKNNLKKWLCMYVGALLLLTTVVTYSKYMSKMNSIDEAKPANFSVDVSCMRCGESAGSEKYDSGLHRPNAPLTYYLKVDTAFDVVTDFYLFAYIHEDFDVIRIEEVYLDENLTTKTVIYDKEDISSKSLKTARQKTQIDLLDHVMITESNYKKYKEIGYKFTVQYKGTDFKELHSYKDSKSIINIGYRADQKVS